MATRRIDIIQNLNHLRLDPTIGNKIILQKSEGGLPASYVTPLAIKVIIQGSENCVLNGRKFNISRGQFLVCKPQSFVKCVTEASEYQSFSVFLPNSPFFKTHFLEAVYPLANNRLSELLIGLRNNIINNELHYDFELINDLSFAFEYHQKEVWQRIGRITSSKSSTKKEVFHCLLRSELFIEKNITRKISLEDLCDAAGLSKYHYLRKFQEAYGESPHQYVLKRKISKACLLIERSEYSLSGIAKRLGFIDIHRFSKVFKRVKGIPPSEFRRKKVFSPIPGVLAP